MFNTTKSPTKTIIRVEKTLLSGLVIFSAACNFSISLSQIGLGLSLLSAFYLWRHGFFFLKQCPILVPFAFFSICGIFSIFGADEKLKALIEMKKFLIIVPFLISWNCKLRDSFQMNLLYIFLFFATLTGLSASHSYLSSADGERVKGFFSVAITFGECQAIAAIIALTLLSVEKTAPKLRFFISIAFLIVVFSMVISMSRGAWLGFFGGVTILTYFFPKKLVPILIIMLLALTPAIFSNAELKQRFDSFSFKENLKNLSNNLEGDFESSAIKSNFERLLIWTRGFRIAQSFSVFGVGMNNVKKKYFMLASDFERQSGHLIYGHQHNNFMQFFVMTGLLGLTAFSYFLIEVFAFLIHKVKFAAKSSNRPFFVGALAVFFCFIITGLTEYSWGDEEVAMMAFFFTGLLLNRNLSNSGHLASKS